MNVDLLKSPCRTTEHPAIAGVPFHLYQHCSGTGNIMGILAYEYVPKVVVNRFFETRDDGLVHVIYWEFGTSGNYLWSKFFWKDESWKCFGFCWPWEPFGCAVKIHVWSATIQHSWWKKSCTILDVKHLVNSGIKLPINWCNISSIESILLIRLISPHSLAYVRRHVIEWPFCSFRENTAAHPWISWVSNRSEYPLNGLVRWIAQGVKRSYKGPAMALNMCSLQHMLFLVQL